MLLLTTLHHPGRCFIHCKIRRDVMWGNLSSVKDLTICSITGKITFALTLSSCPLRYRPWERRPPDSAAWRRVTAVFYPRCGVDALLTTQVISAHWVWGNEKWAATLFWMFPHIGEGILRTHETKLWVAFMRLMLVPVLTVDLRKTLPTDLW